MGKHNPGRLAAIVVSVVGYAISLVFNGLSVVGIGKSGILLIVYWGCYITLWMDSVRLFGNQKYFKYVTFFSILTHYLHFFCLGPYSTTTANVSSVFDTQITPSGWTFNIWSIIYIWLTAMVIYILTGLCRKLRPNFFSFSFRNLKIL